LFVRGSCYNVVAEPLYRSSYHGSQEVVAWWFQRWKKDKSSLERETPDHQKKERAQTCFEKERTEARFVGPQVIGPQVIGTKGLGPEIFCPKIFCPEVAGSQDAGS
jgi:hypothetical protein